MDFDPDRLDRRDPELIARVQPLVRLFNERWLRLRVEGLENLPQGPALLVSNHNGGIAAPDVPCTFGTIWDLHGAETPLYGLAHDFAMRQLRPFGAAIQRFGALRASRDNALRALAAGALVLVYPGGDLDAYRHARRRDEVVFGPRTGFVRVAVEAGVPVVPVVLQGAHRSAWVFHEGEELARWLRLPERARLERFPLALALPWGLAVGPWLPYLPLPFPVRLRVLPPVRLDRGVDPAEAREHVRELMQTALDRMARP